MRLKTYDASIWMNACERPLLLFTWWNLFSLYLPECHTCLIAASHSSLFYFSISVAAQLCNGTVLTASLLRFCYQCEIIIISLKLLNNVFVRETCPQRERTKPPYIAVWVVLTLTGLCRWSAFAEADPGEMLSEGMRMRRPEKFLHEAHCQV